MRFPLNIHDVFILFAGLVCLFGCAAYTGPKIGSTAEPPVNPPRPPQLEPVYYEHEVQTEGIVIGSSTQVLQYETSIVDSNASESTGYSVDVQEGTVVVRDGTSATSETRIVTTVQNSADALIARIKAAYSKRGKPLVTTIFYKAPDTVRMAPTMMPLIRRERSIEVDGVHTHTEKGDASLDVDINDTRTTYISTGNDANRTKLISWSDVHQTTFDVLRTCGIRVTDAEMTTLQKIDRSMGRTAQGVSLHTAEIETLRQSVDFDVLILIQEISENSNVWLQARAWDLSQGTMLAACRTKLIMKRSSATGELLARRKVRLLATEVLKQAAVTWENM